MRKTIFTFGARLRTACAAVVSTLILAAGSSAQAQQGLLGPLPEPLKLMDAPNFDWGGWLQLGWQSFADGAFTGNGPTLNQKEWGDVNINQLYVYTQKSADGQANGIDWGFRTDLMYGVDGNEAQAFGNVDPGHWDYLNGFGGPGDPVTHGPYEFAMPQVYGEIAINRLTVKIGHFYTPIGYEVVTSPDNFFLSRQLTFYNSEPFTHTGGLGTFVVNDSLTILSGWAQGMDTGFYRFGGGSVYLGGFTWAINDAMSLTYGVCAGNMGARGDGSINSLVLTAQITQRLSAVVQADLLESNNASNFNDPASLVARDSTGLIGYTFYDLTDRIAVGSRAEWYKADGVSYYETTSGLNMRPMANVNFRPEARYMWSPGNAAAVWNQTVLGGDLILTY